MSRAAPRAARRGRAPPGPASPVRSASRSSTWAAWELPAGVGWSSSSRVRASSALAVGAGVEEAAAVRVGEQLDHPAGELARRRQPARREGRPVQAQQPVAEVGVVVELAQVRGGAVGVDPPQPAVHDQGVEHEGGARGRRVEVVRAPQRHAGLGEGGDREAVPGGHHLVVARRRGRAAAGPRRGARAPRPAAARRPRPPRPTPPRSGPPRAGSTPPRSCPRRSRRSAGSPPAPARASAARPAPAGVQTKKAPSPPGESASCADGEAAAGQPHLAQQVVERLLGHAAVPGASRSRGGPARSPGPAGRCRRASSRSGAPASGRRRCSGGSRRPPGRRCRRRPSCPASAPPSRARGGRRAGARGGAAGTRAPATAGTWAPRRTRPRPGRRCGPARRRRRPAPAGRSSSREGARAEAAREPARHLRRLALHVVAAVAVGLGDRPAEVRRRPAGRRAPCAGSRCRRRTGARRG